MSTKGEWSIKPLDPRLLKTARAARWFIAGVVALAFLGTACTVGFAFYLSEFVAQVFAGKGLHGQAESVTNGLIIAAIFGIAKAGLIWLQEWLAVSAAGRVKQQLRQALLGAITRLGSRWLAGQKTSELTLLATVRLNALDAYFARFLPQLVYTALVTPALTALIWANDFWSGVAVVCTLPLIPLFMIMIGWATKEAQEKQLGALNQLAGHFGEVLRGLTTLRVFGRLERQPQVIHANSEAFRTKTMRVLRLSFLSGLALEVAASLSVALVAVSIGIRLINGNLTLATGLFVLLLAPEAYLPLRAVGAQFHASSEGVAASKQILDIIDEDAAQRTGSRIPTERIEALFPTGKVTRLTGASGSGKTTALNEIRSILTASLGDASIAWLPQRVGLLPWTVRSNIVGGLAEADIDAQALTLAMHLAALDDVSDQQLVGENGAGLSGGQAQRVGAARAFYRSLTLDAPWLILDEPLSALDEDRRRTLVASLEHFASLGNHVVVTSHQAIPGATELAVADV